MLEIKKEKIEWAHAGYYQFVITTDEGSFAICFAGNLDLYWRYLYQKRIMEEPESKSFTITKENYYVYSLFERLYYDVKKCNIFELDDIEISCCEDEEEIESKRQEFKRWNNNCRRQEKHNPHRLFQNNAIEWHCDDYAYDDASVLKIKKRNETFIITIEKSKIADPFFTYSVRFRNSGSRHQPFNSSFMKLYKNLIAYNPEYHQVHMEEYSYCKKLKMKK